MREEAVKKLREVVRNCVSKHLYSSAIFFADKVAAFTSDPANIYKKVQALFLGRHYRRAFHLLNASQIVLRDLRFRYLAAKCLVDDHGNFSDSKDSNVMYLDKDGEDREINGRGGQGLSHKSLSGIKCSKLGQRWSEQLDLIDAYPRILLGELAGNAFGSVLGADDIGAVPE
ncbi:hypothetical protein RJ641_034302 [Dillenia turbinata]|uniref:Uncharacterized protein n=1 Tax=Dillenia turbinata TaxID=194707 RepID=A0AAN8VR42_9MAGN